MSMNVGIPQTPSRRIAKQFEDRLRSAPDRHLAARMSRLVSAIAKLVEEERVDRADLRALIRFATEVGHASDARRSEWVLLADTLGITSLVEQQVTRRPPGATPNTIAGPFYRTEAPARRDGESISIDGIGEPLVLTLQISDLDGDPVADALIEVWQANADGVYENQAPDLQPDGNLRGRFRSGDDGRVIVRTVRPKGYAIPSDGPVGELMKRLGLSPNRPAHLHFRISAAGFETLTTHLFDSEDPALDADPLFAVDPALVIRFDPCGAGGYETSHRFILARAHPGYEDT
ncbi:6-chlorohydroxyquinol-1,2-dioxygenase [Rhodobacterales bacterium HKCCE4037]|nr:6-chlorohydroxyquinol-1,2-dioxygenase [Rhodobacterales bacterium HKCCE4037]